MFLFLFLFLRNFLQLKCVFDREGGVGLRPTPLTRVTSVTLGLIGMSIPIETSTKLLCVPVTSQMIPPTRTNPIS